MVPFILAVALLGDWTAAGWVANPRPPAIVVPDLDPTPDPAPDSGARPPAKLIAPPRPPAVPAPPVAPPLHRQADLSGQVWESTDLASLQAHVTGRNAQFAAPPAMTRFYAAPSSCATGRCPR